ncbi:MAG: hypothetical protein JOZ32_03230 [Bryobacterales bacterium]|nr:hypothetical protein [Bryobacterales bacterium]
MLFPVLEAIHVMGLALSVGTIAMFDARVLSGRSPGQLGNQLMRWTWTGFAVMLVTGAALFLSNVHRYLQNPGFIVKMGLLAVALIAHFTVHRKGTRYAALLSLVLWSSVVISARAIADLDH